MDKATINFNKVRLATEEESEVEDEDQLVIEYTRESEDTSEDKKAVLTVEESGVMFNVIFKLMGRNLYGGKNEEDVIE